MQRHKLNLILLSLLLRWVFDITIYVMQQKQFTDSALRFLLAQPA